MLRFFCEDAKTLLGAHEEMHSGHLFIAKATHGLVYFSLIMLPTTGLLIAGIFSRYSRNGYCNSPIFSFSIYVTIGIHVAASLYSRFKGKAFGTLWSYMARGKSESKIVSTL